MKPHQLIGLPYRLGAEPEKHHAVDCLTLTISVLNFYGIKFLKREKEWYKRYLRKDFSIFKEVFDKWGNETKDINIGTVAIVNKKEGFALAVYYEGGFLICQEPMVRWTPQETLAVEKYYCPQKSNYVKLLE